MSFCLLPEEVLEIIVGYLQDSFWPPAESVITNWNNYPSPEAQHDLGSLSLVCRTLHRIIAPRLMKSIVHDFSGKKPDQHAPYQVRYQWLSPQSFPWKQFPPSIQFLYLQDLLHYTDPVVEIKDMVGLLRSLSGSLEVLVARGFCASVLIHTLSLDIYTEVKSLKTLKIYAHTINVGAFFAVLRTFPNLLGLTLDTANIEDFSLDPKVPPVPLTSTKVTHLEICTRLYTVLECIRPVVSLFTSSHIETLLLTFRNRFPQDLLSMKLQSLKTLFISTYAYTTPNFWESDILSNVKASITLWNV
ncbi:hypothetical protein O181_077420 [Austropuccinia psidii MF-1]|uniref:F-box domain-containing protein n=1 Tax=Austropuccinia psidii MF-1 TaxID=1389203 RepID=A0A9Q3FAQ2_9BASI|nr:hypothetical protein [Austropuccinia psidii MF-1]